MDENELQAGPLRIGDPAPNFWARSTEGQISLEDYRGKWLMLLSHPGDFTPVCTSEFIALASAMDHFVALDCAVVALSVDSLFAHLAWIRAIADLTGIAINFPIIEDPTLAIAKAYGMVSAGSTDAATVRASFFIDPDGIVRAVTYYPATIGRSVTEAIRILKALQENERSNLLVPADWQPGAPLLHPPAHLGVDALHGGPSDWFYRFEDKQ